MRIGQGTMIGMKEEEEGVTTMTISLVSTTMTSVSGFAAASAAPTSSTTQAASTSQISSAEQLPPAPLQMATYPKSLIPQPFPPAFPTAHLPPPDPSQQDTVTISDAARKAADASTSGTAVATTDATASASASDAALTDTAMQAALA